MLRLDTNRRQRQAWERDALQQLRAGDTAHAFDAYRNHDAVYIAHDRRDAYEVIIDDWWKAFASGERVLMLASRHIDVDRLNALARRRLAQSGRLTGPAIQTPRRTFQAGDHVMMRRNDRRLGVCNGQTGTVLSADRNAASVVVAFDDGPCRPIPHDYIAAGHVDHAYASTIHKAQGRTVDRCFVLADACLYREAAYVALSRGRAQNQLYIIDDSIDPENLAHGPMWHRDSVMMLKTALATSRSQSLALDKRERRRGAASDVPEVSMEIEL
jgi:ATP-dependent exoDNAse (exonuclease V) alpha subunit